MVICSDRGDMYGTTIKNEKEQGEQGNTCLLVLSNYIGDGNIDVGILRLLCMYDEKGDE